MSAYVYERVVQREKASASFKKKYGVWCQGLPGLVRQCGLAQAVAFLEAKSKRDNDSDREAFRWLLEDLKDVPGIKAGGSLQSHVQSVGSAEYLMATRRIQMALVYFKRFAESVLGVKEEDARDPE